MIGIDATTVAAKVVEFETVGDGTDQHFPCEAVSQPFDAVSNGESSISTL